MSTFLLIFTSCAEKKKILLSDPNTNICDLISIKYSFDDLMDIKLNFESIELLHEAYPIQCIKRIPTGFKIMYVSDDEILILFFDQAGNKIFAEINHFATREITLQEIKNGQNVTEIQEIDPNGNFIFLYASTNDAPRESTHYTSNGYMYVVSYDENYNVISVTKELI